MTQDDYIIVGKIGAANGVKGWVKIISDTQTPSDIFEYKPWHLNINDQWQMVETINYKQQGKNFIAQLPGYNDRNEAEKLTNTDIAITKEQLPALSHDETYWVDLEGLEVVNLEGVSLGKVDHLFSTGANDVLVVDGERERLIPYLKGKGQVIKEVNKENRVITVDWDSEF